MSHIIKNFLLVVIKIHFLFQARKAGCKKTVRQGASIKMLQSSGQTLPLWVGKPNEKPPPLCGAIPADPSHVAKVFCFNTFSFYSRILAIMESKMLQDDRPEILVYL